VKEDIFVSEKDLHDLENVSDEDTFLNCKLQDGKTCFAARKSRAANE
jgi:hypothetical protein